MSFNESGSVLLFVLQSISLSVFHSIHTYRFCSIYLSSWSFIHQFLHSLICLSITPHPSIHLSIHPSFNSLKYSFIICRMLKLDLVPRMNNEQVDVERISPVELYQIHQKSATMSETATVSTLVGTSDAAIVDCGWV